MALAPEQVVQELAHGVQTLLLVFLKAVEGQVVRQEVDPELKYKVPVQDKQFVARPPEQEAHVD